MDMVVGVTTENVCEWKWTSHHEQYQIQKPYSLKGTTHHGTVHSCPPGTQLGITSVRDYPTAQSSSPILESITLGFLSVADGPKFFNNFWIPCGFIAYYSEKFSQETY